MQAVLFIRKFLFLLLGFHLVSAQDLSWNIQLPEMGTFSSPRCTDLNGDGVLDIVIGAGREEFESCDSAVLAIDGYSGDILWKVSASDQIFGSAAFIHINHDSIHDVIMNGRSASLMAVDGKTGKVIWRFLEANEIEEGDKGGWYNFYNAQVIPDLSGDDVPELILSNGGDVMVEAYDPNRPPGHLVIVDGSTGKLISKAQMPDDKETYMSILVIPESPNPRIVYGTGGETVGGSLWVCRLSDVVQGDLSNSELLASSSTKGYLGPAVAVDLNHDQVYDIVTTAFEGRLQAFDGKTNNLMWSLKVSNTESYNSVAVGFFDGDSIPDLFVSFGRGAWPNMGWSTQRAVSGKDGKVLFVDSLGYYQMSSALACDLNGDGRDEVIMSFNFQERSEIFEKFFYTTLVCFEFNSGQIYTIGKSFEGSNLASTPWLGDLDQNGFYDIIYCHGNNLRHTYTFDGMTIHRLSTDIQVKNKPKWGAYQGSHYNGVFASQN